MVIAYDGESNRKMPTLDDPGFASCDAADGPDDGYSVTQEQGSLNLLGIHAIDSVSGRR